MCGAGSRIRPEGRAVVVRLRLGYPGSCSRYPNLLHPGRGKEESGVENSADAYLEMKTKTLLERSSPGTVPTTPSQRSGGP